jgi:hypothetical protein
MASNYKTQQALSWTILLWKKRYIYESSKAVEECINWRLQMLNIWVMTADTEYGTLSTITLCELPNLMYLSPEILQPQRYTSSKALYIHEG